MTLNVKRPLADRMRPKNLEGFVGQEHLVAPGKIIFRLIEEKQIHSMIFWGPPGSGKTTLARIIAEKIGFEFVQFSAAFQGTGEIKKLMKEAQKKGSSNNYPILVFIDEIHRFNKSQQAIFLPFVEAGDIVLIGATTENPSFEIISSLLSRCRVFVLNPLSLESIGLLIKRALSDPKNGLGKLKIKITKPALDFLIRFSHGDARIPLNTLEIAIKTLRPDKKKIYHLDLKAMEEALQHRALLYDKNAEEHYNLISALHKSLRGSDANAGIYWLSRMLEAGEDPLYIARRLVRFASEDIGLADPQALIQAVAVYQACHFIGMPECNVILSQAVIYLARAPKSNQLYSAYQLASQDAHQYENLPVPIHLRNASTRLMKELDYGKNYKYSPDYNYQEKQEYLPKKLKNRKYYLGEKDEKK